MYCLFCLVDESGVVKPCNDCNRRFHTEKLRHAQEVANISSRCRKVKVGSFIEMPTMFGNIPVSYGANVVLPNMCDRVGCNRILPHDNKPHCVSTIHSEIDAIIKAKRDLTGATIYVTRYPCENCARAIVTAGIKKVIYGRKPIISEDTANIFKEYSIEVIHVPSFNPPEGE